MAKDAFVVTNSEAIMLWVCAQVRRGSMPLSAVRILYASCYSCVGNKRTGNIQDLGLTVEGHFQYAWPDGCFDWRMKLLL
jgi:hypothetical protein